MIEGKQTATKAITDEAGIDNNGPTALINTEIPKDKSKTFSKNVILLSIDGILI